MTRVITSIIGIPALIYIIQFAPLFLFVAVTFLAMLLALYEYYHLTGRGFSLVYLAGYLLAAILFFSFYSPEFANVLPLAAAVVLLFALLARLPIESGLSMTAYSVFGAIYLGGLMGYLIALRQMESGDDLVMMLFVIIWAGDILAYLVGRQWGRHKLSAVSPKKTVEGAIGGLLASVLAGIGCRYLFVQQLTWIHAAVLGGLVGIMGQAGDLCESLLKRSANVKDSGAILPGHGGMLDRVDSLLFGAPTMYYYFYFLLRS